MSHPILSPQIYLKTFAALLVLLFLTVGGAYISLGPFNLVLALTISVSKTALIVLLFMQARWGTPLLLLAAFAGVFWLGIMFFLVFSDYASRDWAPARRASNTAG